MVSRGGIWTGRGNEKGKTRSRKGRKVGKNKNKIHREMEEDNERSHRRGGGETKRQINTKKSARGRSGREKIQGSTAEQMDEWK